MTDHLGFGPGQAGLRQRLSAGGAVGAVWLSLGSPAAAECMAVARPDVAVFDLQHGFWSRESLEAGIAAVRPYTIPLARTMSEKPEHIGPALEAGAAGVIVPLIESAEMARAAVSASRFPPHGERSGGGVRPLYDLPAYIAEERKNPPFVALMIETAKGLDAAAEICATEGIDMIFVGTGDLALSLGTFPAFDDTHTAAVQTIIDAAKAAGRSAGVFTGSEAAGPQWRARGAQMTILAADNEALRLTTKEAKEAFDASTTS